MGKTLSLLAHPTEGRAAPQIKIQEVNLRTKSEKKIIINGSKLASVMKIKGANNNKITSNNPASNELKFGIQIAADALFQSLKLLLESKKNLLRLKRTVIFLSRVCMFVWIFIRKLFFSFKVISYEYYYASNLLNSIRKFL